MDFFLSIFISGSVLQSTLKASISNQAPDLSTCSQKNITADKITEKVNHYGSFNMFKIDITEIANIKIGKSEFNMILKFDAETDFWENFYYYPDYGLFVNDYYYVLQSGNGEVSLQLLENATQLTFESECIEGLNFNQSYVDYFSIQNNNQ